MIETFETLQLDFDKPIFDVIGFNGPIIVTAVAIIQLLYRISYLIGFIVASILNENLNRLLKNIIKEERPKDGKSFSNEKYGGAHIYGMPSGHSQVVFFVITFLWLSTQSIPLLIFTCFVAALTLVQRYRSKKHTIAQLAGGCAVGGIFGYISYKITERYVLTKKSMIL
jgi:membrane-associated phospholipid phosphatase